MPFDQVDFAIPSPTVSDPVLDHLVRGRAAISNPARWCQGETRNADGQRCSWGALRLVNGDMFECEAEKYLAAAIDGGSFLEFNDNHSHAEVLAMWDRAIASRRGA